MLVFILIASLLYCDIALHQAQYNDFEVEKQIGGTCYAHAVGTAIIETEGRISGRKPPSHKDLVKEILDRYGYNGSDVSIVLRWQCGLRRLGYEKVDFYEAKNAVKQGRTLVASFPLDEKQVRRLSQFGSAFKKRKVMQAADLGGCNEPLSHHAVAIVSLYETNDIQYWKFKNSWGEDWGDHGYGYLEHNATNFTYYDVYYRYIDLGADDLMKIEETGIEVPWSFSQKLESYKNSICRRLSLCN